MIGGVRLDKELLLSDIGFGQTMSSPERERIWHGISDLVFLSFSLHIWILLFLDNIYFIYSMILFSVWNVNSLELILKGVTKKL